MRLTKLTQNAGAKYWQIFVLHKRTDTVWLYGSKSPHWAHVVSSGPLTAAALEPGVEVLDPRVVLVVLRRTPIAARSKTPAWRHIGCACYDARFAWTPAGIIRAASSRAPLTELIA